MDTDGTKVKIWLLTIGEYSSYKVLGVFDNEHKAEGERIAELMDGNLEEDSFILNGFDCDEPPKGMKFFNLEMKRHGQLCYCFEYCVLNHDGKKRNTNYVVTESKNRWRLDIYLYAKDEKHAIKITNELRIQILAGAKPSGRVYYDT